jgi:hypothetical protein
MIDIWLVRTINGRVRVKWRQPFRDEGNEDDTTLEDRDFDDKAAARAFAENLSGRSDLKFLPDLETSFQQAMRLRKQNPDLSPEEAMAAAGFRTIRLTPADAERLGYRSRRQIDGEAIPPIRPDPPSEPSARPYYDQIKHWWGE